MNVVSPQFIDDMIAAIERVAERCVDQRRHHHLEQARVHGGRGSQIHSGHRRWRADAQAGVCRSVRSRRCRCIGGWRPAASRSLPPSMGWRLGGGYELALACHHRVIVDDPKAVVGLPEVTVGLLPGSGGTQRFPRMIGLEKAASLLLDGRTVPPVGGLAARHGRSSRAGRAAVGCCSQLATERAQCRCVPGMSKVIAAATAC